MRTWLVISRKHSNSLFINCKVAQFIELFGFKMFRAIDIITISYLIRVKLIERIDYPL